MYDALISHAQDEDGKVAQIIVEHLEADGVRCWIAPRDIPPGMTWNSVIGSAVEKSRFVVTLISSASISSQFVSAETIHGFDVGCTILPIRLEDVADYWRIDLRLKTIQPVDYFGREEHALKDVFDVLRSKKAA